MAASLPVTRLPATLPWTTHSRPLSRNQCASRPPTMAPLASAASSTGVASRRFVAVPISPMPARRPSSLKARPAK